jgi:RNA polymerase sigma-70 factor (ECF subfamily)
VDKPDIRIIKEEISKLPEGFRIVLSLYLLEGYDHDEIGEILGISASTSRSQYSRARKKLVLNLKRKQDESGRIFKSE